MIRWLSVEELRRPLPEATEVAIVGGGIMGTALAYYLAREGVEVVLVERGELNREASGTNGGSLHLQIAMHQLTGDEADGVGDRLRSEVRLHVEAGRAWRALEAELGASMDVHVTGGLMIAETSDELRLLHDKQRIERDAGLETRVLTGAELRRFAPYLADDLAGASFCPEEGHINPLLAAPLFALRAFERGAVIRTHAEVTGIEARAGRGAARFAVTTTAGRIDAHRVVNAAGAWAGDLARATGLRLPIRREGLHVNVTEPRDRILGPLIQHVGRRLTLKQATNGTFIIGGGWPAHPERRPARYSTLWESAAGNAAVAVRVVPSLADVRVVRTWSGVMAFIDDLSPIVGESGQVPGYHGLIAPGFTFGPYLARVLAEQMTARADRPPFPPEYSPDRASALQPAAA